MKHIVYLDDGHGLETSGKRTPAISELGGRVIKENEFNSKVVDGIKVFLSSYDVEVVLVAPGDKDVPLSTRVNTANQHYKQSCAKYGKANVKAVYVSVHYDAHTGSFSTSTGEGHTVFVYNGHKNKDAGTLATHVLNELVKGTKQKNRGVKEADFHVLRETDMVAILTENGFMDNKREAMLMIDAAFIQECSEEHARGILKYFNIQVKAKEVNNLSTFKDVSNGSALGNAVDFLQKKGIVNGYPDGTYRPNQQVTRGELALILQRLLTNK